MSATVYQYSIIKLNFKVSGLTWFTVPTTSCPKVLNNVSLTNLAPHSDGTNNNFLKTLN